MSEICKLLVAGDRQGAEMTLPVVRMRTERHQAELDRIAQSGAAIVLISDCRGADDLQRCDIGLSVAEARAGLETGSTRIIAGIDSAVGLLALPTLAQKSLRLAGLAWSRTAFSADIGCGMDAPMADHAWIQVQIAAKAFDLPAYDRSPSQDG